MGTSGCFPVIILPQPAPSAPWLGFLRRILLPECYLTRKPRRSNTFRRFLRSPGLGLCLDGNANTLSRERRSPWWGTVLTILLALPVAAGVLYPVKSNGTHVRLDPVWASLAMA